MNTLDTTKQPTSWRPVALLLGIAAVWGAWVASLAAWDDGGGSGLCIYAPSSAEPCHSSFALPGDFWVNYGVAGALAALGAMCIAYGVSGNRGKLGWFARGAIFVLGPVFIMAATHLVDPSRLS